MPPSCHRRAPCVRFRAAASPAGFTLGGSSKYRAIASICPGRAVGGSRGATGVNPTDGMGAALTSHPFRPAGQGDDVGQHRHRNPHLPSDEGALASLRKERRSVRLVSEEVRASRAPPPVVGSDGVVFLGSAHGEELYSAPSVLAALPTLLTLLTLPSLAAWAMSVRYWAPSRLMRSTAS